MSKENKPTQHFKVGDLVNFRSNSWIFRHTEKRYANPGIIIATELHPNHRAAQVYWADGRTTKEHNSYLQGIEVTDETNNSG